MIEELGSLLERLTLACGDGEGVVDWKRAAAGMEARREIRELLCLLIAIRGANGAFEN